MIYAYLFHRSVPSDFPLLQPYVARFKLTSAARRRAGNNILLLSEKAVQCFLRTGFEKKLAISKAGQFLSKVVPEEDKSKRK